MKKPSAAGCDQKAARDRVVELLHGGPKHASKMTAMMKRRALKKKPCKQHPAPHE
jgi:hypothetical protein